MTMFTEALYLLTWCVTSSTGGRRLCLSLLKFILKLGWSVSTHCGGDSTVSVWAASHGSNHLLSQHTACFLCVSQPISQTSANGAVSMVIKWKKYGTLVWTHCSNRMQAVVPSCYTLKRSITYGGVRRMCWAASQPEERSCSGVCWYDSGYFSIVCQTITVLLHSPWILSQTNE